jgi:penicillin-binding protein 1A
LEGCEQLLRNQQEDLEEAPVGTLRVGLRALFNLALILGVCAVIVVACLYLFVAKEFEGDLDRTYPELPENFYVYDVNGQEIGEFRVAESSETVGFEGFGEHLPGAVVALENRRFYDHRGFDPEGLARAAWTDLPGPGTSMRAALRLRSRS